MSDIAKKVKYLKRNIVKKVFNNKNINKELTKLADNTYKFNNCYYFKRLKYNKKQFIKNYKTNKAKAYIIY